MRDKKKILYFITKGNFGGAQRYVFDLATNIPKEKFDVVVAHGEGETLKNNLEKEGIRTIQIKSLNRNISLLKDILALFEIIKIIKNERPNVVHLNSSKIGGLGSLAVRILNLFSFIRHSSFPIRSVFTGHGWAFNEERSFFQKVIIYFLHWVTVILSHATIAVSERTANQIKVLPFIKKKIKTIHNGINSFDLNGESDSRNILAPQIYEKIWIGTISELHKNKGLDYLLRAFAILKSKYANVALVIVGGGEEEENLKSLTDELGLKDKVAFVGFKADARKYLKAFDIFTLSSRTEAFPYAPLEAGIASLPVVASWVGGIPEIITNNESGLLVDPENTEKLGESLNTQILKEFSIKKMIEETVALY
jgi:glycosyltransferase involved in cell wall biosynthesis